MKPIYAFTAIALMLTSIAAHAATDSNYYIADQTINQQFRTHSDGKNTFIDAVPGLVVLGATADGDSYVLTGEPREIKIQMNGRATSLIRGNKPGVTSQSANTSSPNAAILAKINQLEGRLKRTQESGRMADGTPYISDDDTALNGSAPVQEWVVLPGDVRLAATFDRWAKSAGWRVQWDANKHLLIDSTSTFSGSFVDAVKAALMTPGIRFGAYPLEACVYAGAGHDQRQECFQGKRYRCSNSNRHLPETTRVIHYVACPHRGRTSNPRSNAGAGRRSGTRSEGPGHRGNPRCNRSLNLHLSI